MKSRQLAFNFTREQEGGYSDNPNDPGRETIAGISRVYHPKLKLWGLLDEMHRITNSPEAFRKAIQTVEIEKQINLFYKSYWNKFHCSKLKPVIGIILFDTAFMTGKAVKLLQESINFLILNMIKEDNDIGEITIKAANSIQPTRLGNTFLFKRLEYQVNLKDSQYFYKGWVDRIVTLSKYI